MSLSLGQIPDRIAAWPRFAKAGLAFVCGATMVPAMPPWCFWPAMFFGFSIFYVLLSTLSRMRAGFVYGWLFGFGYFGFGLSWIANALLVEGNQFAWFWPFAVAGLPALLALFTACASMLAVKYGRLRSCGGWLMFITLFMIFEWLRGHAFTGFPWNLYSYAWGKTLPVAQLVSAGGAYWLSLLTCLWATLPGFLYLWNKRVAWKAAMAGAAVLVFVGSYIYGDARLDGIPAPMRKDLAIRLVQPGISQADKWNPRKTADNLNKLLMMSEAKPANSDRTTIIVWPETAISDYLLQDTMASSAIKTVLAGYDNPVYLLSGVMRYESHPDGKKKYFNSLVLFDNRLNVLDAYDKSHLVPFGEYIPLQKWIPLKPFVKFSGFEQGSGPRSVSIPSISGAAHSTFSPLVCYEIIFPGAVADKNDRPGFLVNVTNDSWYGDSSGPHQHFVKAQFRAIEEGLPVVRSANTGISGVIDPAGRILYEQDLFTQAGNNIAVPEPVNATFYARFRDLVFALNLLILLVVALTLRVSRDLY